MSKDHVVFTLRAASGEISLVGLSEIGEQVKQPPILIVTTPHALYTLSILFPLDEVAYEKTFRRRDPVSFPLVIHRSKRMVGTKLREERINQAHQRKIQKGSSRTFGITQLS